jgi:hypothetical protein
VQSGIGDYGWTVDFGRPGAWVETADSEQGLADAAFIAEDDPARVLREIDTQRQVIAEHDTECWKVGDRVHDCPWTDRPCRTLRPLALPYAGRPGYREQWRP